MTMFIGKIMMHQQIQLFFLWISQEFQTNPSDKDGDRPGLSSWQWKSLEKPLIYINSYKYSKTQKDPKLKIRFCNSCEIGVTYLLGSKTFMGKFWGIPGIPSMKQTEDLKTVLLQHGILFLFHPLSHLAGAQSSALDALQKS